MNPVLYELLHKYRTELNQPLNDIKDECWDNIIDSVIAKEVIDDFLLLFKTEKIFLPSKFIEMPHNVKLEATLMPPYLKTVHFVTWLRKFNQLINKIGLPGWDASEINVNVQFSSEEQTETYGTMSLNEVKDKIRRKWKLDKRAEETLSQIRDIDAYYNEQWSSPLAEEIHITNEEDSYEKIRKILDELFGKVYCTKRILGKYCHTSKTIVLYVKNIECTNVAGRTTTQNFELTFIHELFHAYHYRNNDSEIISRHDYTSTVVKESLATAFEWGYCVKNTISGDLDLRRVWEKHSVLAYPYSGAQALTDQHKRVLKATEFCDILKESPLDMDKALRDLLPLVDFYNIKNLIISDMRKAFDAVMKMDKIGVIAQREIPAIIKNKKVLREKLHDKAYCQNTFNISYAVLSPTCQFLSGKYRYYEDPIIVDKKECFLCSEWDKKRHLNRLLDWIWANR
jgi:hypothetical protein